jgi:putative ABC transport system substrate-binding protein
MRSLLGPVAAVCLLTTLAISVVAPLVAEAQPPSKTYKIGFLASGSPSPASPLVGEFQQGLRDLGYVDGQNLAIEYRWAEGKLDRLPELAADLVRFNVDLIVAPVSTSAQAAHEATRTIPIVMIGVGDPIGLGLAASLARPGGNVTGTASYGPELAGKSIELLKEVVHDLRRVAVFFVPANPAQARTLKDASEVASALAVQLQPLEIVSPDDLDGAFRRAATEHAAAVWVLGDPMFIAQRDRIAALALSANLPTMFLTRANVDAGGLISYGPKFAQLYRRAATYVDKILKGAKPSDLPIEQPTTFELVINLKTAKALRVSIPQSVLVRADEVVN